MKTIIKNDTVKQALQLLKDVNLDWKVLKEPLYTSNGLITDHIATVRQDTNVVLGVQKEGYEVIQNQTLAELIVELSNRGDAPIHNAGYLKNGEKVFIQLKTGDLSLFGDKIRGYLTAVNSFDGTTSLAYGGSTLTVSCMNTFFGAYKQIEAKIKHTKNIHVKIDSLLRTLDLFRKKEQNHFQYIRRMASTPINQDIINKTYSVMFKVSPNQMSNLDEEVSTKMLNNIKRFNEAVSIETNEKGESLWGLFSGVTRYTTHMMGNNMESKMFGYIANKERCLFDHFTDLLN